MKRSIDQINWMPEIVQQIQSFTEFAEGVPVTACDELLKVLEEGNDQYYVVKNEDWNIFIRKIGPQKASKMFCSIKNLGITSGSAEKEFARDANGFCDMVAWCKATLLDLKTRGPCPTCLTRNFFSQRMKTADFCARCCMNKILLGE